MRERPVLQVGHHVLDDRVAAVGPFGVQHGQRGVGERGVVAVALDQRRLGLAGGRQQLDPTHDRPGRHRPALTAGGECGVASFGDLGVGRPATGLLVHRSRSGSRSGIHAWSPMPTIAARDRPVQPAVMDNCAGPADRGNYISGIESRDLSCAARFAVRPVQLLFAETSRSTSSSTLPVFGRPRSASSSVSSALVSRSYRSRAC